MCPTFIPLEFPPVTLPIKATIYIATKEYKITPELKDRLRVYVEGLNENHIDLNNQAAELDQKVMDLKRSINDSYKEWRKTHEEGQEPDSVFNKSIADRYKQAEVFEKQASDLRQRAKEKVKLTPQEQEVFDKVYKPLLENRKEILQFLMDSFRLTKVMIKGSYHVFNISKLIISSFLPSEKIIKYFFDVPEFGLFFHIFLE